MKKQIGLIALSIFIIAFVAFSGVASAQASNVQVLFFYSPHCSVCEQVKPLVESAAAQTGVKLIEYNVSKSPGDRIAQANGVNGTPTIVIQGGATLRGNVTEQQIDIAIQAAVGDATTNATTNATPTSSVPTVSLALWTPSTPTLATHVVNDSQLKHSSEVAVSSNEKPQSSTSLTNTTQSAAGAKELNADPENCSAPLTQPTSLVSASQKCLVYAPSLPVPADSSNAFAEATAISAEASALSQNGSVPSLTLPVAQTSSTASLPAQSVFEFALLGLGAPALLVGLLYLLLRKV